MRRGTVHRANNASGQKQPYKYWSGATLTEFLSGYDQLWVFYEKIPKLNFCQK